MGKVVKSDAATGQKILPYIIPRLVLYGSDLDSQKAGRPHVRDT